MKTFIIIVLSILLCVGAFLSRPAPESFKPFIEQSHAQKDEGFLKKVEKIFEPFTPDSYVEKCTFKDRYLWVDVERDGKTIYTGVFNHWFAHE